MAISCSLSKTNSGRFRSGSVDRIPSLRPASYIAALESDRVSCATKFLEVFLTAR